MQDVKDISASGNLGVASLGSRQLLVCSAGLQLTMHSSHLPCDLSAVSLRELDCLYLLWAHAIGTTGGSMLHLHSLPDARTAGIFSLPVNEPGVQPLHGAQEWVP